MPVRNKFGIFFQMSRKMKWEAIKMTSRGCVSSRAEADTSRTCRPAASTRFIHIGWTPGPNMATPRQCGTANDPRQCTVTAGDFSRASRRKSSEAWSSPHQSYRAVSSALKGNLLYSPPPRVALTHMLGKVTRGPHAQTQHSIQSGRRWHLDALLLWLIIQSEAINSARSFAYCSPPMRTRPSPSPKCQHFSLIPPISGLRPRSEEEGQIKQHNVLFW